MKIIKFLEILWLIIAIVGFALTVYSLIEHNNSKAIYFTCFMAVAGIMYFIRRRQRKQLQSNNERPNG